MASVSCRIPKLPVAIPVVFKNGTLNADAVDDTVDVAVVETAAVPPIDKPDAVPVMFVPTNVEGVPRLGVTSVGELDNTMLPVPVTALLNVTPP